MDETLNLKCGCIMTKKGKVFLIKPCSLICEHYRYALEESKRIDNEIIYVYTKELRK